jgi:hypothetical protein
MTTPIIDPAGLFRINPGVRSLVIDRVSGVFQSLTQSGVDLTGWSVVFSDAPGGTTRALGFTSQTDKTITLNSNIALGADGSLQANALLDRKELGALEKVWGQPPFLSGQEWWLSPNQPGCSANDNAKLANTFNDQRAA